MEVHEGQKMTEVTRTSTPKNNNVYLECRIELDVVFVAKRDIVSL